MGREVQRGSPGQFSQVELWVPPILGTEGLCENVLPPSFPSLPTGRGNSGWQGRGSILRPLLLNASRYPRPDDPVAWTFRRGLRDTVHLPSPRYFLSLLPHTCSMCPHPGAEEADLERRVTNLQTHACDTLLRTHTDPPNGHTATSPSHRHRCIPSHRHRHAQAQIWKHMGR